MNREYHRVLLLFVDGLGLAPAGPGNPLANLPTPTFQWLLGGPLTVEQVQTGDDRILVPLDPRMGVPGIPQSATGQTALFTGVNAARVMGRHVTAFPGPKLREIIQEHSLLRRAAMGGRRVTFANAYTRRYFEETARGDRRHSVTTLATQAAGLRLRTVEDLRAGRAVTWDICRDLFAARSGESLEPVPAEVAGSDLARLAAEHDLTVFETFLTDLAAHRRIPLPVAQVVERLDGFLGGVLERLDAGTTLLLTSDHGNLEDATTDRHTRNPVPLLAVGPAARAFADLISILEVTPRILQVLGIEEASRRST